MRRHGFTLIELLVVVSIIALLIAILLPSMAKARELARRTVCASNQHQMAISYIAYGGEHRGALPKTFDSRDAVGGSSTQYNTLPYVLDKTMWELMRNHFGLRAPNVFCPSGLRSSAGGTLQSDFPKIQTLSLGGGNSSWPSGYSMGYVQLQHLHGLTNGVPKDVATSPQRLEDGGTMHLIADRNISWQANTNMGTQMMSHVIELGPTILPEGANRTYLDAHTEWISRAVMGDNNTALEPTTDWMWGGIERWDHWVPGDRRYYW